ncbi:hypothetical protein M422DRAFT_41477 [Sphaerobolus stellatus SS14]|nr:hypothetical protein M422DRAFT_41477 [Sphaerobolus stellatus SS14]
MPVPIIKADISNVAGLIKGFPPPICFEPFVTSGCTVSSASLKTAISTPLPSSATPKSTATSSSMTHSPASNSDPAGSSSLPRTTSSAERESPEPSLSSQDSSPSSKTSISSSSNVTGIKTSSTMVPTSSAASNVSNSIVIPSSNTQRSSSSLPSDREPPSSTVFTQTVASEPNSVVQTSPAEDSGTGSGSSLIPTSSMGTARPASSKASEHPSVGPIIGGILGAILALLLLTSLYFLWARKKRNTQGNQGVRRLEESALQEPPDPWSTLSDTYTTRSYPIEKYAGSWMADNLASEETVETEEDRALSSRDFVAYGVVHDGQSQRSALTFSTGKSTSSQTSGTSHSAKYPIGGRSNGKSRDRQNLGDVVTKYAEIRKAQTPTTIDEETDDGII